MNISIIKQVRRAVLLLSLCVVSTNIFSQGLTSQLTPNEVDNFKGQARYLVRFLEGALNDLASPDMLPKEKQTIINETFLKFFRDDKVQVEDDLDDNRKIIINKNIQAYLKDVDFFFKKAVFEFAVEDVDLLENKQKGFLYIKVKTTRILKATTIANEEINSTKTRFIEININPDTKDMKIASIYSIKITEEEELREWWRSLSNTWRLVFKKGYSPGDTITYDELQQFVNLEEINISNNPKIMHIKPLGRLRRLKKVRLNKTSVKELEPLRNLLYIETLECSNTKVLDISSLKYLATLKELDISSTAVKNIKPLAELSLLRKVDINHTPIKDISVLSNKKKLQSMDCSYTYVQNLNAIAKLPSLNSLQCAGTQITSITPLVTLTSLEYFNCQKTNINSLNAIKKLPKLKKLYCAETRISENEINTFIIEHPECLVVYKSKALSEWWRNLDKTWKLKFMQYQKIGNNPTKEQLHKLINIKHIDVSGSGITDLKPLNILMYLKEVNCSNTTISDLSPLKNLVYLEILNCSGTKVSNLMPLSGSSNLRVLNVSGTQVSDLAPVAGLKLIEVINSTSSPVLTVKPFEKSNSIRKLYLDNTKVKKMEIELLRTKRPNCFVVYQTLELQEWWDNLSKGWQKLFSEYIKTGKKPNAEQLQQIANLQKISIIENLVISDLKPLIELKYLKELNISGANITSLVPLINHSQLEVLICSNCRIRSLIPLSELSKLKVLECENTPLRSIKGIENNTMLQKLSFSGSKVRLLSPVKGLKKLQYLDCSNTNVYFLSAIKEHKELSNLKCFNTHLLKMIVTKYEDEHKKCEVRYY